MHLLLNARWQHSYIQYTMQYKPTVNNYANLKVKLKIET